MAAPAAFINPLNPSKSFLGTGWNSATPPPAPVRRIDPLNPRTVINPGLALPSIAPGVGMPPPAPVTGQRQQGGGSMSFGMGQHFNQSYDKDTGAWSPLTIDGSAGPNTTPNANPGMGMIAPIDPIAGLPTGSFQSRENAVRGFASGGTTQPGETALVGEHGPEMIQGQPNGSVAVLPNDLLRGSGGTLEIKPGSPYLGAGANFSTGVGAYGTPPPAPVQAFSGSVDGPPMANDPGLGAVADRTPAEQAVVDSASAAPTLTPDQSGGSPSSVPPAPGVAPDWRNLLRGSPVASDAGPQPMGTPLTPPPGAPAPVAAQPVNPPPAPGVVPPARQMGMVATPEHDVNEMWDAARTGGKMPSWVSPKEEQYARRFARHNPGAMIGMDTARQAAAAKVNQGIDKANVEQRAKNDTLAETTRFHDATMAHRDSVDAERSRHNKLIENSKNFADKNKAYDNLHKFEEEQRKSNDITRNVMAAAESFSDDKNAMRELTAIMKDDDSKTKEQALKTFYMRHPAKPQTVDLGEGRKAISAPAGTYHAQPPSPDEAAAKSELKTHQDTIHHFESSFWNFNDSNDAPPKPGMLGPIRAAMMEDYNTARDALKGKKAPGPSGPSGGVGPVGVSSTAPSDALSAALNKIK